MADGRTMTASRPLTAARSTRPILGWVLFGLGLVGAAFVLFSTRLGPFLSDDSYYYVYPARDWIAGLGFHPSQIFAPLFPFTLGLIHFFGPDPLVGARFLNAALFGVNIFLIGKIVRRMGAPAGFAVLASALVLLSDAVIEAHGWMMSEALSFTFILLAFSFTLRYLEEGRRHWWAAALLAVALAALTRYAAIPILPAVALTLLVYAPLRRWGNRLGNALSYGLIGILPLAAYMARNIAVSGRPFHYRQYFIVPFTRDQLIWFLYNTISYFIPGRFLRGHEILAGVVLTVLIGGLVLTFWLVYRKRMQERGLRIFTPGLFLLLSYLGFCLLMLFLARGLTELDVFNPRYLTPMLIAALMVMAYLLGQAWRVVDRPIRWGIAVFLAVFVAYYGFRAADYLQYASQTGIGYSNVGWHNSETIPYLIEHPELSVVATGDTGIYFWTGRLPAVITAYGSAQGLRDYLCESGAALIIMDQMPVEMYHMSHDEVVNGLTLVRSFNDSQMYQCIP